MDPQQLSHQLKRIGLQHRESQLDMIQSVTAAIKNKNILCIEAPTGTGKTISYCLGSYLAKQKNQIIVISTATIALQEQLINNDLPLLCKILQKDISYALAKGRRRYVCLQRLYNLDQQGDLLNDKTVINHLQDRIEKRWWDGDRDNLEIAVADSEWQSISTDATGCSGKLCEFYEDCAFYKARKKIYQSDIIITNHSLLLSDLELGAGAILPEPQKNIYIIDECHHLPRKALDHIAKSTSIMGSVDWINQLTRTLTNAVQAGEIKSATQERVNQNTHELVQVLKQMYDFIDANQVQFDNDIWQIKNIDGTLLDIAKMILQYGQQVYSYCEGIIDDLEQAAKAHEKSNPERAHQISKFITQFGFIAGRAKNLMETWRYFCHERKSNEAPIARWFAKRDDKYICHAAPINVSQELKLLFWDIIENGAVLCSATIRALGKFDDFRRKSGLKDNPKLIEKNIDTFFRFDHSVLFIPTMQAESTGNNQAAHRREAIELLPQLILPNSGTLVLFTSKKAMEETYAEMPDEVYKDILMQGKKSKAKLIETHKNRIRQGKRSILFGLTSFGEGMDLPADFCQHVIIHKLPFAVPNTPIEKTRSEWLAQNNMNAFMLSTLPEASIRLTQYVGRLVRQESDFGIVTVLDKRLYSKSYGTNLLQNLPNFTKLINCSIEQLKNHDLVKELYQPALSHAE